MLKCNKKFHFLKRFSKDRPHFHNLTLLNACVTLIFRPETWVFLKFFVGKLPHIFFSSSKKYSISNHLVQWTFNSCKSVFSRAQFKKIFHWKKVLEGACKFVFQDRGRRNQPARLGLFAWHFGASFRAGVKPFAFSQWLTANYVKPLI